MNNYIIIAMLKHIVVRILFSTVLLTYKRLKRGYDIRLVKVNEDEVIISALLIGTIFALIIISSTIYFKGSNYMIIIASILLAIGLSQQLISLSIDVIVVNLNNFISEWNSILSVITKIRHSNEWRYFENECNKIFIYPHIIYSLPADIRQPKIGIDAIIKYIEDHKDHLDYIHQVYEFEPSLLAFSQHLLDYLHEKLLLYDNLTNIQQRTGNINPILFIAIGTLIWLLS